MILCYADDVTQLISGYSIDTLKRIAQEEIDKVTFWEHDWRIKTNRNKSKIPYFFHNKRRYPVPVKLYSQSPDPTHNLESQQHSTWTHIRLQLPLPHTHVVSKKAIASKALSKLYPLRHASQATKFYLYKTLILPLLSYAHIPLSLEAPTNRKQLQRTQNRALTWVFDSHWQDFTTSEVLHERANIPSLNIVWDTIGKKHITIILTYHDNYDTFLRNTLIRPRKRHNLFT
nr:uncharacterized protein LOC123751006 [Procambarus clarkii]